MKHTALEQNLKKDTCIEFRQDIQALTLLAATTSSEQHREKILTRSNSVILIIHSNNTSKSINNERQTLCTW